MQNMHRLQLKIALYVRAVTPYDGRLTNMKETKAAMGLMFMTDLDGTLLGHEDFSFASIRDDILDLLRDGITLVPLVRPARAVPGVHRGDARARRAGAARDDRDARGTCTQNTTSESNRPHEN